MFSIPSLLAVGFPIGFTTGLSRGTTTVWGGAKMSAVWEGAELETVRGSEKDEEDYWGRGWRGRMEEVWGILSLKSEVSSNQDMCEKSKGDGSKTASERPDSDLVLGKINSKF